MPLVRWIPLLALAAVAIAYVALPYSPASGLLYGVYGAAVVALLIVALLRFDLDQRDAWVLLLLGVSCWVAGDATWFVLDRLGVRGFPSFADLLYLAAYPLWFVAFLRISRATLTSRGEMVDAAVMSVSIGVVAWMFVLGPLLTDPSLPRAVLATTLAYTLGDMLLLLLIVVSVLARRPRKPDHVLLVVAIMVFLVTNLFYTRGEITGSYIAAGAFDLGWLTTYLLFVAAAWHPAATRQPPPATPQLTLSTGRLVVLAATALFAPLVTLLHTDGDPRVRGVATIATMVILLLVIHRVAGLNRRIGTYVETLEQLAQTDPLTGAMNRRHLDLTLARELSRAARTGSPLCVAMLDVDHFKRFNDTFGHAEGDQLLRGMVDAWQEHLREFDAIARYGGEEFLVVLPSTDLDEAVRATERLRAVVPRDQRVSAGVARFAPGETADDLTRRADEALYAAKRAGRDRVVAADSLRTGRPD